MWGVKFLDLKGLKANIREDVWRILEEKNVTRFPRPVHGRIPNFLGAEFVAEKVKSLPEFIRAEVVFCNPDSPQRPVRETVLKSGKKLIMSTPRLRQGFLLLEPQKIPEKYYGKASTIRGSYKYGINLSPWDLPPLDLKVTGSVAVTKQGIRLGKGEGYSEIEAGILGELGKMQCETPVITTVHELQIVDKEIPKERFDLLVDIIATPKQIIRTGVEKGDPKIIWSMLDEKKLEEITLLKELKNRLK